MQEKQVFYYNLLNYFPESNIVIIGVEFKLKDITLIKIKLHIWDIAGQERYKTIAKNFYKYSQGIIFVYDISSQIVLII